MLSTFKKCDLHIHSSSCCSRKYSRADFIGRLVSSDLDVIAITDHNSVDITLLEDIKAEIEPFGKALLAGVEVNVGLGEDTLVAHGLTKAEGSKGKYFHAVIWTSYDDRCRLRDVVDELFVAEGYLTQKDIKEADESPEGRKALSKKTEGKWIRLEKLQEKLDAFPYYFVPHEGKGSRNLSDYLPDKAGGDFLVKNREYKNRLLYYSHAMAVEGGEKSRKRVSTPLEERFATTIAALFFSDAQKLGDIGGKYTWIDFDGDLDSLLLAISDPESRIRTSDTCSCNPQCNIGKYLECVSFDLVDGRGNRHKQDLEFSPGFNGVVGARGSGKSMLAHILEGGGLDAYAPYVVRESIRYKLRGAAPSRDVPRHICLNQGDLEEIFKSGKYEEIPFLKSKISKVVTEAEKKRAAAREEIENLVSLERELSLAFVEKYPSGGLSLDALDSEPPSGFLVDFPSVAIQDDEGEVGKAKLALSDVSASLSTAADKLKGVGFKTPHAEASALFDAFDVEIRSIEEELGDLRGRLGRLSAA